MAVDDVLLSGAAQRGEPTLRFYGWSEPTVTLGYFQSASQRVEHAASAACRWVRRGTGGGAIVHDDELTYSVTVPSERPERGAAHEWYRAFHETLCEVLADWGVQARLCVGTDRAAEGEWLCFRRRAEGDVVLDGAKICGSAQRRHAGAVLQHGSVLLGASRAAPELAGLAELTGRRIAPRELAVAWRVRLERRLGWAFREETLPDVELQAASCIQSQRFECPAWNDRR